LQLTQLEASLASRHLRFENGLLVSEPEVKVVDDIESDQELPWTGRLRLFQFGAYAVVLPPGEPLVDRSVPLSDTKMELPDLCTGHAIAQTTTDTEGSFFYACGSGVYALRVTPPKNKDVNEPSEQTAVELDSTAKLPSLPQRKVLQSRCDGVQLSRLHGARSGSKIEDRGRPY